MKKNQAAERYAKALYSITVESGLEQKVLEELRNLRDAFNSSAEVKQVLFSPVMDNETRTQIISDSIKDKGLSEPVIQLVGLLAKKGRLELFDSIVESYQSVTDAAHGVVRGQVLSPHSLEPAERNNIENIISKATQKKVILEYKQSPELLGGLVAQVGSLTFDDSIDTQLKLMSEHLNRRTI